MSAISEYIKNMNQEKAPTPYRGFASKDEWYKNTSCRKREYSPQMIERLDRAARRFVMRPKVTAPNVRYSKLGWCSDHILTDQEKKISTTGYVETYNGFVKVDITPVIPDSIKT